MEAGSERHPTDTQRLQAAIVGFTKCANIITMVGQPARWRGARLGRLAGPHGLRLRKPAAVGCEWFSACELSLYGSCHASPGRSSGERPRRLQEHIFDSFWACCLHLAGQSASSIAHWSDIKKQATEATSSHLRQTGNAPAATRNVTLRLWERLKSRQTNPAVATTARRV